MGKKTGSKSPKSAGNSKKGTRKVYKDTELGITKSDIKRLGKTAGIKRFNGDLYDEVRHNMKTYLDDTIRIAQQYARVAPGSTATKQRKTINSKILAAAIEELDHKIAAPSTVCGRQGIRA